MLNAVVLWNTAHIDRITGEFSDLREEDLSKLSHRHISMLGRFSFEASDKYLENLRDLIKLESSKTLISS